MSKTGHALKRATGLMKIHHMNYVLDFRARLAEHQAEEADRKRRAEGMETCQQLRYLMTQEQYDAWWEAAPEIGFFDAARAKLQEVRAARSYKGKHVPGKACPLCGGLLMVRERRMRQRGKADYVTEFVSCTAFETKGCRHNEPLTDEIRAAIDSVVYDDPEF